MRPAVMASAVTSLPRRVDDQGGGVGSAGVARQVARPRGRRARPCGMPRLGLRTRADRRIGRPSTSRRDGPGFDAGCEPSSDDLVEVHHHARPRAGSGRWSLGSGGAVAAATGPGPPAWLSPTRVPDRLCFWAILIRLVTGASWADIEAMLDHRVSDTTLRARRDEWIAAGVFEQLEVEAMAPSTASSSSTWATSASTARCKAPYGGEGTGPNPTDRGRLGWKWSVASERHGVPIGWTIDGANRNDIRMLEPPSPPSPTLSRLVDGSSMARRRSLRRRALASAPSGGRSTAGAPQPVPRVRRRPWSAGRSRTRCAGSQWPRGSGGGPGWPDRPSRSPLRRRPCAPRREPRPGPAPLAAAGHRRLGDAHQGVDRPGSEVVLADARSVESQQVAGALAGAWLADGLKASVTNVVTLALGRRWLRSSLRYDARSLPDSRRAFWSALRRSSCSDSIRAALTTLSSLGPFLAWRWASLQTGSWSPSLVTTTTWYGSPAWTSMSTSCRGACRARPPLEACRSRRALRPPFLWPPGPRRWPPAEPGARPEPVRGGPSR